jgi:hypothetical protein
MIFSLDPCLLHIITILLTFFGAAVLNFNLDFSYLVLFGITMIDSQLGVFVRIFIVTIYIKIQKFFFLWQLTFFA